jgi:hypothetical protein
MDSKKIRRMLEEVKTPAALLTEIIDDLEKEKQILTTELLNADKEAFQMLQGKIKGIMFSQATIRGIHKILTEA